MLTASSSIVNLYQSLSQIPRLKGEHLKITTSAAFTPIYVQSLISNGSSDTNAIYANKVQNKQVALDNPSRKSRMKELADQRKARQKLDKARGKTHVISRKRAAATGIWDLKPDERSYEVFRPLHNLWRGYIAELLGLPPRPFNSFQEFRHTIPNMQNMQSKLVKADFHGSILSVRNAKNASIVNVGGIVIQETENTFKIITMKNQLKVIPKQNSTFVFKIPLYAPSQDMALENESEAEPVLEFELYGSQFAFRSSDRATKKFEHKLVQ